MPASRPHEAAGLANPCRSAEIRRALAGLARIHGRPQRQASPLDADALAAIEATAGIPRPTTGGGQETVIAARRRALVDVAPARVLSDAGLRRSEASALAWGDVREGDGEGGLLHIQRSKTDSEGEGELVAITRASVEALDAVRPVDAETGTRVFGLSARQLSRRVAAMAAVAGLQGHYSGHSGRVGLAVRMARNGAPAQIAQRQGRWKSADTLARYTRGLEAEAALRYL